MSTRKSVGEIRDPIYGYIFMTEVERALIDTRPVQRLRRIKQLSGAYLTYPGAEHSRFSHSLGVRNGNVEYIEQGAVTASYYFTIHWAKNEGFQRIDFGLSRPFLKDGVFVYKKRWGMALKNVNRSIDQGVFGLKISVSTESVRSFLVENPFVFIDRDKLVGLIVADQCQPLVSKDMQMLIRIHHIKGLDKIIIVSPHGFAQDAREMAKSHYPRLLYLTDTDPAVIFNSYPFLKTESIEL